jgi:pilus assembly protein Flp/PilA
MSKIKNWTLTKLAARQAEEGQGLAEYGLILALIAVVCIFALTSLGTGISGALDGVTASL